MAGVSKPFGGEWKRCHGYMSSKPLRYSIGPARRFIGLSFHRAMMSLAERGKTMIVRIDKY